MPISDFDAIFSIRTICLARATRFETAYLGDVDLGGGQVFSLYGSQLTLLSNDLKGGGDRRVTAAVERISVAVGHWGGPREILRITLRSVIAKVYRGRSTKAEGDRFSATGGSDGNGDSFGGCRLRAILATVVRRNGS